MFWELDPTAHKVSVHRGNTMGGLFIVEKPLHALLSFKILRFS
jgi:hypothetical protein